MSGTIMDLARFGPTGPALEDLLREVAAVAGDRPAILDATGVRATHADLRRQRDAGRARLREAGVGPRDRVALVGPSDWRLACLLLAATSACAVATIDPALPDHETRLRLRRIRPRAIVTDRNSAPRLRSLADPDTKILVWSADDLDGGCDAEAPGPDDTSLLLFTSGTTAEPKAAALSQRNLAVAALSIADTMALTADDRALNVMTLHHGHGIFPMLLAPLVAGGASIITPLTDADGLLATVRTTAPTWISAAPVLYHALLAMGRGRPELAQEFRPRAIRSGSSMLTSALCADLERTFRAPVVEAYALTEAPGQIASNPLAGVRKPGTVGLPAGVEIMILTSGGEIVDGPGGGGEVIVRGPNIMPGYLDVPDEQQPFLDGWLRTGDQGSFDEDGYLSLGGRIVDYINRGAELFSPAEIESVLAAHPAVAEVVAFGRAHPTLGQEPAAAVVLRAEAIATPEELIGYAADRLVAAKVPVAIHLLPALPRGQTGKIVRRRVRDLTERRASTAVRRLAPPR